MADRPLLPTPQKFFGRSAELKVIVNTIITEASPRIALLGAAGIGKTALSGQVLVNDQIVEKFGSRRYFIACDAAHNADDLLTLVSNALKIQQQSGPLQKRIIEKLKQDKTMVVLDNFESPWEPPSSRTEVEKFLAVIASVQNLTLLITMRGIERPAPGKVAWTRPFIPQLTPLDMTSAKELFMSLVDCPDDDPNVETLLNTVECLPLAVELLGAAAQIDSTEILLQRWKEEQSSMLTRVPDRRASLDTSIQISINSPRMDSEALHLLKLLSLLPDGVENRRLDVIFRSIKNPKSAVATLWRTSLAHIDSAGRTRVLSPIRAYMNLYHFPEYSHIISIMTYYMGLAKLTSSIGGPHGLAVIHQMTPEIGNLHAVMNLALGPQLATYIEDTLLLAAMRAAIDLSRFLRYTQLGNIDTLRLALAVASERMNDRTLQADILYNLAWALPNSEQESLCREALSIYEETNNLDGQAECKWLLGRILKNSKRHAEAGTLMKEGLRIARQSKNKYCEAKCLSNLSEITFHEGDTETATQQSQEALQLFKHLENYTNIGYTLFFLGTIETHRSRYSSAMEYLNEATIFLGKAGAYVSQHRVWIMMGDLSARRGDFLEAQNSYQQVWSMLQDQGLQKSLEAGYACLSLAEAAAGLGQEANAHKWLNQAMSVFNTISRVHGKLYCAIVYGDLAFARGSDSYEEAAGWYKKALDYSRSRGVLNDQALTSLKYGMLKTAQTEMDLGLRHIVTALAIYRKTNDANGVGKGLFRLGEWLVSAGERLLGKEAFLAALPVCRRTEAWIEEKGCVVEISKLNK